MCYKSEGRHPVTVLSQKELVPGVYELYLEAKEVAKKAKPGQFVNLYCQDGIHLLPRPISLCEYDREAGWIRLVYSVVGKGTEVFSKLIQGDKVDILGPLGHGFPLEAMKTTEKNNKEKSKVYVIGGGIGIPPLLQLAKESSEEMEVRLGYRDQAFLIEDFEALEHVKVHIATESGAMGTKGNVLHIGALEEGATVFSCGPLPMLRAIQKEALAKNGSGYLSLEERMGCGFGACVGCVCKIKTDSGVQHKKVCSDGPVFNLEEVCFDD